ncbi:hypothetical protein M405DRAFT_835550 [Rhizopogon salebrosus TDB-379]|nr:hypothetical protein M405DRAFT_835550 [Rhizopogon salebrosus TDB-379]
MPWTTHTLTTCLLRCFINTAGINASCDHLGRHFPTAYPGSELRNLRARKTAKFGSIHETLSYKHLLFLGELFFDRIYSAKL